MLAHQLLEAVEDIEEAFTVFRTTVQLPATSVVDQTTMLVTARHKL